MKTIHAMYAVAGAILLLGAGRSAACQTAAVPAATPTPAWSGFPDHRGADDAPMQSRISSEHLERTRQTERQRRMIADTDRLLALAAELKANLDKTVKDAPPSPEDLKKAIEIEKLARSVKERMKG